MTQAGEGPASATETSPSDSTPLRPPLVSQCKCPEDTPATAADLLRQLSRSILDGPRAEAEQRLNDAAAQAAAWAARGLCGRTAAATILLVAGQAAGIGQDDVLGIIRRALQK